MAGPANGHVGNFTNVTELIAKCPPTNYIGCSANVGATTPYIKYWCDGITWAGISSESLNSLTAPGILSNVTYDSSNRAIIWTLDGVTYTADYSVGVITVAATEGTITHIGVDPAQRITSVTTG